MPKNNYRKSKYKKPNYTFEIFSIFRGIVPHKSKRKYSEYSEGKIYDNNSKLYKIFKDIIIPFTSIFSLFVSIGVLYFISYQIDISEKSMKISNKPYVIIKNIKWENNKFVFKINNFGNTPSFNTNIIYSTEINNIENAPNFVLTDTIISHPIIMNTLKDQSIETHIMLPTNKDTLDLIDSKKLFFSCFGKIIYTDIFNEAIVYKFCFRISNVNLKQFEQYNEGNYFVQF